MSFADIWERGFWTVLIMIFVTLVWLKLIDPHIEYMWSGFLTCLVVGGLYFWVWVIRGRNALKKKQQSMTKES
jgi:hypothetical protein